MASQTLTGTATVARVNLLPPEIAERAKVRRLKAAMVGTGLAAVGVVGAMYVTQSAKVSAAQDDLVATQARTTTLQAQVTSLRNVSETYARRQAAEQALSTAMAREVRWSRFLNDLSLTIPSNVWLNNMTVKQTLDQSTLPVATPGGTTVLQDPGLGSVSFQGMAFEYYDVAAWLEALQKQAGYTNTYVTKVEVVDEKLLPDSPLKFDTSVDLNNKALSNRYTKRVGG